MAKTRKPKDTVMQSTRQILDELDALMEQMLALPVEDEEAEQQGQPAPAPAPSLTLVEPVDPAGDEPQLYHSRFSVQELPNPPAKTDYFEPATKTDYFEPPAIPKVRERLEELEASVPEPAKASFDWLRVNKQPPAKTTEPAPKPALAEPTRQAEGTDALVEVDTRVHGYWLWVPLLVLNGLFDTVCQWLGPVGRWLRGPQGRGLLGGLGIVMLVAAAAWLFLKRMGPV